MKHVHETACPMDCPDACSLSATVENGRVTALDGDGRNPFTAGFMCSKMKRYPERMYGSDRLTHPLIRDGAKGSGLFRIAEWDEALDRVADALRDTKARWGGRAILPYAYNGSNGVFASGMVDEALWRSLEACEPLRTLCAAPASGAASAVYGKMPGTDPSDWVHAKTIVLWGQNPRVSNIHLVPHLHAALDRGARLVVLDPRRTGPAKRADLHVPVWPGSDLALALALIAEADRRGRVARAFLDAHTRNADLLLAEARPWTLERAADIARVPVDLVARLYDAYAGEGPVVTRVGWGLERNRNGDGAMAAILALPAIFGHFGVRGGGYLLSQSGAWRVDTSQLPGVPNPRRHVVNMSQLGSALTADDPKIRTLVVYDANPMVSSPNQSAIERGLLRDDLFTVVLEQVMTDTCRFADVILPVPTFLEQHELHRAYGTSILQRITPAVPLVGDVRPNEVVFADVARRLGFEGPAFDPRPEALEARWLSGVRGAGPGDLDRLKTSGTATLSSPNGRPPVAFVDVFPYTDDGRADLHPEAWRRMGADVFTFRPDPGTSEHPFAMLSPATDTTINSILGELQTTLQPCHVAPSDAARLGIVDGDRVEAANDLGRLEAVARIDPDLRPGILVVPKGIWRRNCPSGFGANAVIPETVTPATGGASYNDARVHLRRLGT